MKYRILHLLFAGYWSGLGLVLTPGEEAQAQPATVNYMFQDQAIALQPRTDVVAVQLRTQKTRGGAAAVPFNQLKRALGGGARAAPLPLRPLANQFALIDVPTGRRRGASRNAMADRLKQRSPVVQSTLPVLTRPGRNDTIVVPNQILITLQPGHSLDGVLARYDLALIRPLRFTQDRYVVRSRSAVGLGVLAIATQLNRAPELISAVPNFVQTVFEPAAPLGETSPASLKLPSLANAQSARGRLLPHQWHLDSRPRLGETASRTDIRGVEAWKSSRDGKGVVVAVIDSLIQWDHPDLKRSLYRPKRIQKPLPNEVAGWDFATDDPNTRMDASERQWLTDSFRHSFNLKDTKLLATYPRGSYYRRRCRRTLSLKAMAGCIRTNIRRSVAAEFHGTWTAGVIAARPQSKQGVYGVAPKAKILPVRALGLGGGTSGAALAEAIRYAAARQVDVINLSLGGYLPSAAVSEALADIHRANPNIVVVASAGNRQRSQVSYPAGDQEVIAVGATSVLGNRSHYSNYGKGLDVVAPGGELAAGGGIVTTGGTGQSVFWDDVEFDADWGGYAIDPRGQYAQVEGTSFAAPIVSGVMALMVGEDRKRRLDRPQLTEILLKSSAYAGLRQRPSPQETRLHYGHGLVNAEQAVKNTRQALKRR